MFEGDFAEHHVTTPDHRFLDVPGRHTGQAGERLGSTRSSDHIEKGTTLVYVLPKPARGLWRLSSHDHQLWGILRIPNQRLRRLVGENAHGSLGTFDKDSLQVIKQAFGIIAMICAEVDDVHRSLAFIGKIERVIKSLSVSPQPERWGRHT